MQHLTEAATETSSSIRLAIRLAWAYGMPGWNKAAVYCRISRLRMSVAA
jgi:hypothetical protein